jgi:hypothetical protein
VAYKWVDYEVAKGMIQISVVLNKHGVRFLHVTQTM